MKNIVELIMDYSLKGYEIKFSNPGVIDPLGLKIDMTYYDAYYGKISASYTIDSCLLNNNTIELESIVEMSFDNLENIIKGMIK